MKILKTISIILISIFISSVYVKADKFQIVDLSKINNFERFFKKNKKYKIIIRNKNHLFSQNIIKTFKPKKIEFQNREYYIVDITDFNYHYTLLIHPDIKSKNIIYFYDFAEKISLRNSISFDEDNSLINVKFDKRSPFKKRYIDIKEYMKEKRIRMVVDKKSLLLADENLDITNDILNSLNKKLKSINLK